MAVNARRLFPSHVRMPLVDRVVQLSSLVLGDPVLRPLRLLKDGWQALMALLAGELERGTIGKELVGQHFDEGAHVEFVEVMEAAQCFSSSLSTFPWRLITSRAASRTVGRPGARRSGAAFDCFESFGGYRCAHDASYSRMPAAAPVGRRPQAALQ